MRVLISGAYGLVGQALTSALTDAGHRVLALRRGAGRGKPYWDIESKSVELGEERQVDLVINLAGDNIAQGRWTAEKKARILRSRVDGTRFLAEYFAVNMIVLGGIAGVTFWTTHPRDTSSPAAATPVPVQTMHTTASSPTPKPVIPVKERMKTVRPPVRTIPSKPALPPPSIKPKDVPAARQPAIQPRRTVRPATQQPDEPDAQPVTSVPPAPEPTVKKREAPVDTQDRNVRSDPRIDLQATPLLLERTLIKVGIRPPKTLRRWVRFAALPPLSKSYLEINRALSRLGRKPVVNQTPTERADNLGQSLPEARIPANHLVHEYQLAIFSKQPANEVAALKAGKQIRSLSLKAYMQRLFARLQRRPGRTRPRF